MNLEKLEKQTHQVIDYWIDEYKRHDFEKILMKPSENEWSMGQVGIHLWMSAKGFFFKNAEKCLSQEGTEKGKSKKFAAHFIFILKMMPPVRYEMPKQVAVVPKQPESKEQLIGKLEEIKNYNIEYWLNTKSSDSEFNFRLLPYLIMKVLMHSYFWIGFVASLALLFILRFLFNKWKRKK